VKRISENSACLTETAGVNLHDNLFKFFAHFPTDS
jgi:hypothetical protein